MQFWIPAGLCLGLAFASSPARAQSAADPAPVRSTPFPDVPTDHWAFPAVEELRQKGILRGYPPAPAKPARKTAATPKPRPVRKPRRSA